MDIADMMTEVELQAVARGGVVRQKNCVVTCS